MFFATRGEWALMTLDLILVTAGLTVGLLLQRAQVRKAALVFFTTLLGVLCVIAAVFDVPSARVPRSTHLYLLPLGVAALLTFRSERFWLRHGVALVCFTAFGLLAVMQGAPLPAYAMPEEMRTTVGAWVQAAAALAMLYSLLHIMQNDASGRSELEDELRQAVLHQQFELHYQPQIDADGRVIGAEALLRWNHPQRGRVGPGQFIGLAEETGLILQIGQWVLEEASAQLRAWAEQDALRHLRLAVNISQQQFRQTDFVPLVLGLIDRFGIDPSRLELELTESMLVQDMQDIIVKMTSLRKRGVTFSLDDFGTGFSSLNYLKRLPLNQLKIDQSFVRDVLTDSSDAAIARTVVALGQSLGLSVIAEGVETQGQRQFLIDNGCHLFQGYLFSPALPIDEFLAYARQHAGAGQ
jgi:EAL domain-containing protein (putative c-di-GMP-specific phosphodiesterase class I)